MIEKRKITKKVITKTAVEETEEQTTEGPKKNEKKVCFFCKGKIAPSYTDIATLRRYQTDRAKIVPKLKSNLCSKHQRVLTKQIKYARHLSLLPFTPKV